MAKQGDDSGLKWELLVADAWADPDLKQRLLEDPVAVLKERGMAIPEGKEVKLLEETDDTLYLVLPLQPAEGELSEEELEGVAGGFPCYPPPPCGFWPPPPCRPCGGFFPPPCRPCGGFPPPPPPCRGCRP